ncbi:MAG: response regulator, partial [Candidatus Rifleibacteriota bacterium]
MTEKRIKTLIVDDSAVVRQVLTEILGSDPDIEVIGAVANPFLAVDRMAENAPDVIVLDIEMPRMDGLTFLKKIMTQHPIPVVICSSLAGPGEETTFRALELGAVEIITKPQVGTREFLAESKIRVCDAVKAAASAKIGKIIPRERLVKHTADVILPAKKVALTKTTDRVVVIGASTGGTEALKELITNLPLDCPGVAIVQHM